nr:hypothetical protein [Actinoplanes sp. TFC3]
MAATSAFSGSTVVPPVVVVDGRFGADELWGLADLVAVVSQVTGQMVPAELDHEMRVTRNCVPIARRRCLEARPSVSLSSASCSMPPTAGAAAIFF